MASTLHPPALDQNVVYHRLPPSSFANLLRLPERPRIVFNAPNDFQSIVSGRRKSRREVSCAAPSFSSSSTPMYAKEMERVAAKEALLLAIKDAGGDNVPGPWISNDTSLIDVNERIVSLERLNPTPRPTTSPLLEGLWQFKWIGGSSPGQLAARILSQRFPSAVVTISDLTIRILDGSTEAKASIKIFNTISSSVTLTSKLGVEGPTRLKEEYLEGLLSSPSIQETSIPVQVQDAYAQVLNAIERLPDTVKSTVSNGIKLPLSGTFQRQLLISYLDSEILVARDGMGLPEVLVRLSGIPSSDADDPVSEYIS
ncbi:hypothetical protein KP509_10G028700 [Ceratopteris richardii]|uniref:Plastid lipid-associated protein/fibrillin conserved domain-containing protein n=1 Tax=Ceratopteris richardii TaxID=49495 RepID=A0A8T2TW04_CERRI|nr:hypothetical protein KP509_10G028700 [Ceratopteris richardii]